MCVQGVGAAQQPRRLSVRASAAERAAAAAGAAELRDLPGILRELRARRRGAEFDPAPTSHRLAAEILRLADRSTPAMDPIRSCAADRRAHPADSWWES